MNGSIETWTGILILRQLWVLYRSSSSHPGQQIMNSELTFIRIQLVVAFRSRRSLQRWAAEAAEHRKVPLAKRSTSGVMEKATSLFQETQHIMGGEPYDGGPGTCKAHPDIHSAKHPMQFLQAELGMRDYQARRETTSAPDFWPTPCQPPQNGLFSISYQNTPKHFPARKHWHFGVVFTTIISHWEPCGASYRPQSEGLFPTIWAKLSTLWWVIFFQTWTNPLSMP